MAYDVAVVETDRMLPIKDFATLPSPNYNLITSARVEAVGWGNTEEGMLSKELRKVQIPIISTQKCSRAWGPYYSNTSLCAGRLNKDSCSGDSGNCFTSPPHFLPMFFIGFFFAAAFDDDDCNPICAQADWRIIKQDKVQQNT